MRWFMRTCLNMLGPTRIPSHTTHPCKADRRLPRCSCIGRQQAAHRHDACPYEPRAAVQRVDGLRDISCLSRCHRYHLGSDAFVLLSCTGAMPSSAPCFEGDKVAVVCVLDGIKFYLQSPRDPTTNKQLYNSYKDETAAQVILNLGASGYYRGASLGTAGEARSVYTPRARMCVHVCLCLCMCASVKAELTRAHCPLPISLTDRDVRGRGRRPRVGTRSSQR